MKYVGNKEENIEYRKRPGAYAIIINKNDDKVGIVTDGERYFYLGGGIKKEETQLDTLKRELIEEAGYTIKNIKKFNEIGSYIYEEDKGFLEIEAYVYIVEFDEKDNIIKKILPRKNELIRPPIANIDQALILVSCAQPNFSSNLLDKMLVVIEYNNVKPVICFTKYDLLRDTKEIDEVIIYYKSIGYNVYLEVMTFQLLFALLKH